MNRRDFWWPRRVRFFSAEEIEATGAKLRRVQRRLVYALDDFRAILGCPVILLHNGMTTGEHASYTHGIGLAVDIAFREANHPKNMRALPMMAAAVGFRGIGVYWGGTGYSMHLDLGMVFRQWARWRHHREKEWHEGALIVDPKDLEMAAR